MIDALLKIPSSGKGQTLLLTFGFIALLLDKGCDPTVAAICGSVAAVGFMVTRTWRENNAQP